MPAAIAIVVIVLVVIVLGMRTVRIVPQARVGIIQRLGNYYRTAESGVEARTSSSRSIPAPVPVLFLLQ